MTTILLHPTATYDPAAVAAIEAATGRQAVIRAGHIAVELAFIGLEERITTNYLRALDEMRAQINGDDHG